MYKAFEKQCKYSIFHLLPLLCIIILNDEPNPITTVQRMF